MSKKDKTEKEVKELAGTVSGELKFKKISSEGVSFSMELDKANIKSMGNDSIVFDLKALPADFNFDKHDLTGKIEITLEAKDK
jgi:hypothetical protein